MKQSLIVFGDIHGDFDALEFLLTKVCKVATFKNGIWHWIARNCTLVCLGDFLDRYRLENEYVVSSEDAIAGERKIINCFTSLQSQAQEAQCAFVVLLGNHELANILQLPEYFAYGMRDPNSEMQQSRRAQFLRETFLPFAETCGVCCQWGNYFMCHGGFENRWLVRHNFQSIQDINRRFLEALRTRHIRRLFYFMEEDSVLFSRKMSLHTMRWRDEDRSPIVFRLSMYVISPKFIVGHTTIKQIREEALGNYRSPQCMLDTGTSILASQGYDQSDDAYFVDVGMSRAFWPKNASEKEIEKHRPQAMLFQVEMKSSEILFEQCLPLG